MRLKCSFRGAGIGVALGLLWLLPLTLPASALDGHWQPPGIYPTATPLATILRRIDAYRGPVAASYIERVRIVADGRTFAGEAIVRGGDVRYSTTIDSAVYASGRVGGTRWRQTPAGLVRSLRSDLQGDALDRWPVSIFPIVASDCALVGATRGTPAEWVVQVAPARDAMHWLYVDAATGAIIREETRVGAFTFMMSFDDIRDAVGARRPFHWRTSGAGGPADVFVDTLERTAVDPSAIEKPSATATTSAARSETPTRLPATFVQDQISVDVTINGQRGRFLLDTGTTQILIAARAARRFGIPTVLGHGIARSLTAGGMRLQDVPIMTVAEIFGRDGILGYDFFAGSIVHIDFQRAQVETLGRAGFTVPADADELATNFEEGMPLATAAIGSLRGDRFALDTGSQDMVLPRYFWEQRGLDAGVVAARPFAGQPQRTETYLEGPIVTLAAAVPDLQLGGVRLTNLTARVERTNAGPSIDIPFDAIIGTHVLNHFEWWFDYTGGRVWMKQTY